MKRNVLILLIVILGLMSIDTSLIVSNKNPIFHNIDLLRICDVDKYGKSTEDNLRYMFIVGPLYYIRVENGTAMSKIDIELSNEVTIGIWGLPGLKIIDE